MRTGERRTQALRLAAVSALTFAALLLLSRDSTRAAGEEPPIRLDPVRQRAEMVAVLRSIDQRLKQLVDLQAAGAAEKR